MLKATIYVPIFLLLLGSSARAQTVAFTNDDVEYTLELPSSSWLSVTRLDIHRHMEFVNGNDRANGYLRLRKRQVAGATSPEEIFRHDEKWELKSLPGYVVCSDGRASKFEGKLKGASFSYEYVQNGRPMDGRIYYLQLDKRTFYELHFTLASDKLPDLREQMESIARSFRLK